MNDDCGKCGHPEAEHHVFGVCFAPAGLDPDELCTCCAFSPYAAGLDSPIRIVVSPLASEPGAA